MVIATYGWAGLGTDSAYCQNHAGLCAPERSVTNNAITFIGFGSGKIYNLGPGISEYTSAANAVFGDAASQIRRNAISGLGDPGSGGLVAHYQFEDNAEDVSGSGNHGIVSGGVTFLSGKLGKAAKFMGQQNPGHIRIPNSASLQFGNAMSVAFWSRIDDKAGIDGWGSSNINGTHCFFAKDHDRHGFFSLGDFWGGLFGLDLANAGRLFVGFGNGTFDNWNPQIKDEVPGYTIGTWIHLAYVISATQVQTFLNGSLIDTQPANTDFSIANTRDLYLGKFSDFWYPLNGAIDDFRTYNRALSESEISALYQMTSSP